MSVEDQLHEEANAVSADVLGSKYRWGGVFFFLFLFGGNKAVYLGLYTFSCPRYRSGA